jgi:hypothetical protein
MRAELSTITALLSVLCAPGWAFSTGSMLTKGGPTSIAANNHKMNRVVLFGLENDDEDEPRKSSKTTNKTPKGRASTYDFLTGEELITLRQDLHSLKHNLQWAEALKDDTRVKSLQKAIEKAEKRDPDLMYSKALNYMAQAKKMKDVTEEEKDAFVEKWVRVAASARECLPQFKMEGLWVGK